MKRTRSVSAKPKHHRSVNLMIETEDSPLKKHQMSYMNAAETERLVTRLTDPSSIKTDDYYSSLTKKQTELRMKCEKLYATLDLFKLMDSNNMSIRCMQHNNALTLYCLTERKILCVNCTYGEMKHRTHKVLPLRDSAKYIHQDNEELNKIIKDDFRLLEDSIKNCKENVNLLGNGLNKALKKIEQEYMEKRRELEMKHEATLRRIKDKFQSMISKSKTIEKQIEQFKFKIYECLSRVGLGKSVESNMSDVPVIKQIICSAFTELTKFHLKSVTPAQINRLAAEEH